MQELTESQLAAYIAITEYIDKYGYSPTLKDIAERLNITIQGSRYQVLKLIEKKYISKTDKTARTIKIIN